MAWPIVGLDRRGSGRGCPIGYGVVWSGLGQVGTPGQRVRQEAGGIVAAARRDGVSTTPAVLHDGGEVLAAVQDWCSRRPRCDLLIGEDGRREKILEGERERDRERGGVAGSGGDTGGGWRDQRTREVEPRDGWFRCVRGFCFREEGSSFIL